MTSTDPCFFSGLLREWENLPSSIRANRGQTPRPLVERCPRNQMTCAGSAVKHETAINSTMLREQSCLQINPPLRTSSHQ